MKNRLMGVTVFIWLFVVLISCLWGIRQIDHSVLELARSEAQSHFEKEVIFRSWASIHGGVYVPPTAETPPNPYLKSHPDRDVVTTRGKLLTLVNPAYMTRQVHELAAKQTGVQGHITSLKPLRPENLPDPWEHEALQAFEKGSKEATSMVVIKDQPFLRFMRPLLVERSCLNCHQEQAYKEGEIRGGLSISVPFQSYREVANSQRGHLLLAHGIIALLGVFGIWIGFRKITRVQNGLRESEFLWRFAIEGSGDGVFDWNIQTNESNYSKRWKEMLGYSETDLLPNHAEWNNRIHPDDYLTVIADIENYLNGITSVYVSEFRLRCKNGDYKWILSRGIVVSHSGDGNPLRMLGTHTDITKRKQAEQFEQFRGMALELLARGAPLPDILEAIALGVQKLNQGALCSILLLERDGRHLRNGSSPSLPKFYSAAIDGLEIGPGVGSCGTAAFTGERVIVSDIATHPYWSNFKDLAASAGLGACWSQPICSGPNKVLGTFAIYHQESHTPTESDISFIEQSAHLVSIAIERKQAEDNLRESESRISTILENVDSCIYLKDTEGRYLFANKAVRDLWQIDQMSEIVGFTDEKFFVEETAANIRKNDKSVFESGQVLRTEEENTVTTSGKKVVYQSTKLPLRNADGSIYALCGVSTDITALKEHEEQLKYLAHNDALTGLPNRVLLADRLNQAMLQTIRRKQLLAVAYFDLDGFKEINDNYGHSAGDQLLITVSRRMQETLRESDTLARLGGDEFVAVMIDLADFESCKPMLNRLLEAAAMPVRIGDHEVQVSASMGVAFYPSNEVVEADQLLRQADQAMYQAKKSGKNRYYFFDAS